MNNKLMITETDLIDKDQKDELIRLENELQEALDTQLIWRTYTEARFSVLNDVQHPTPNSKYHQAVREQLVFYEQLQLLYFDYREKQIDLAETLEKIEKSDGYKRQRLEVKRDRLFFEINSMKLQAKDRIRELHMWSAIKKEINDGSFNATNKDEGQLIDLTIRYCREALLIGNKKSSDAGAIINIVGQAMTGLAECQRRGILDKLPHECITVMQKSNLKYLGKK